jgi:indole-3-glycerol phosphate synthase
VVDFLDILAKDARVTVESGYYSFSETSDSFSVSLKKAIADMKKAAIIAEIKAASPSAGYIRRNIDAGQIAKNIEQGGAVGISVLT